jgi:integrative and conjugative element protein (TIGR02256 family)
MISEGRRWAPVETGGMLVGYRSGEGPGADAVVTHLIGSGPNARRERSRFTPDGRWQQRHLDELYASSGQTATYLGDWHTHPRGSVRPSRADRATYEKVAADPQARCPHPVIVIVALGAHETRIGGYAVAGKGLVELTSTTT